MLDRRETKEDDLHPCIPQVAAIREVADARPPPSAWRSLSRYIPAPFARNPQMRPSQGGARICRLTGVEGGRAGRTSGASSGTKSCFGKSAGLHHVFLARWGLNVVQVDS